MVHRLFIVIQALVLLGGAPLAAREPAGVAPPANRDEAAARARMERQAAPPQQGTPGWVGEGVIHSLARNQLNMVIGAGTPAAQPWRVRLEANAQVTTKGEVAPHMLAPRTVVRFKALINSRGVALEPITELEVFTPRPGFEPGKEKPTEEGAEATSAPPAAPVEPPVEEFLEEEALDAEEPLASNPDLSPEDRDSPPRAAGGRLARHKKDAQEEAPPEEFEITGVVLSTRRGKLMVDAGEAGKIRGELADDARVKVNLNSIELAHPGAAIKVTGMAVPNFNGSPGGDVLARTVEVTLVAGSPETTREKPRGKREATPEREAPPARRRR